LQIGHVAVAAVVQPPRQGPAVRRGVCGGEPAAIEPQLKRPLTDLFFHDFADDVPRARLN